LLLAVTSVFVSLLVGGMRSGHAHPMSVSELRARLADQTFEGRLLLDAVAPADSARRRAEVEREVVTGLFVKADGVPVRCTVRVEALGDPRATGEAATDRVALVCPLPEGSSAVTVKAASRFGSVRLHLSGREGALPVELDVPAGTESPALAPLLARSRPMPADLPSPPSASVASLLARYLVLGFQHILPYGLDHLLFVLALFFMSPRLKPLLLQLTTFTAAHSLTLALVAAGVMSPPASLVEPLIAASIVFVGVENLRRRTVGPARLGVVALFGLLHGMGFAGALEELGLPAGREWLALLGFNVGVELGQLAVVLLALGLTWRARVDGEHPRWIRVPASGAIALMGLFWVFERVFV
jgi:hypothetical protein